MPKNEFKNFATFETLITPKIITIVYWLATLLLILGSILSWLQHKEGVSIGFAVSLVATRVVFELVMVSFKNNEYLRRICEVTEAKKDNHQR
ncbi:MULTISPECIES: DUF4282 domain-containing protein [Salmonella]|uniref:DUF4282 domain-containing protein n=1 Tax=Salmonella TaxID=590 RepID=UPI00126AF70D|nr:DUF4282 domain-containing protein [Salmonella enterica]EBS1179291.1 hypothetical protein [Salmonella enterica subsp. enterica serovar Reading]EBV2434990.1 hypothetical protein [Salmonella enterica subsp. enterica serovar Rissen]EBV4048186.1 hypothetical protein [Salmonella enterica subsp. enterica serovar Braenderup]ECC2821008.1 hypothetical protein [Salmonella enterica subsp. enterica]ECD7882880.1 hypothetical protein [Salmonella enterica subsp. enterica serovar Chester]ECH8302136.1 hypot